jgi:3-hydroxybutyryl-CoA dehydratase
MREVSFDSISVGDAAELRKTISEADVYGFARITMDFNPIHVDKEMAAATRFKQRVVHGMLSASMISAVIATFLPGSIYISQTLKFTAPVFFGDTLTAKVKVSEKIALKQICKLETVVSKQDGTVVIEGEAVIMKK